MTLGAKYTFGNGTAATNKRPTAPPVTKKVTEHLTWQQMYGDMKRPAYGDDAADDIPY